MDVFLVDENVEYKIIRKNIKVLFVVIKILSCFFIENFNKY